MASGMELKLFAIHFLLTMTATMMGFPLQSVMLTFRLGTRVVSAAGKTHVPVGFLFLGKRFHYEAISAKKGG